MQHARTCTGHCGTWRDNRNIVWNFCRMTDSHLANVIRHLTANIDRLSDEDRQHLTQAEREAADRLNRRMA